VSDKGFRNREDAQHSEYPIQISTLNDCTSRVCRSSARKIYAELRDNIAAFPHREEHLFAFAQAVELYEV
jgi:hypothetical protein